MDSDDIQSPDSQSPNDLPARPYILTLVSHSHSPPLVPAPHLKFDLRKITNPPKHIRDAYDGRSKRLREHMLANDDFVALVGTAHASIMEEVMAVAGRNNDSSGKDRISMEAVAARRPILKALLDVRSVYTLPTLTSEGSENPEDQSLRLTAACFCEQGRHRSVAFVEELARKEWPDEWDVEIRHRDVENHGSKSKSQRHPGHKDSRKNNQKFVGLGEDL